MPVSFSSPPRNLFLLGSSGADAVSNFFAAVDGAEASTSFDVYQTDEIRISDEYTPGGSTGVSHFLAGTAQDSNSKKVGWITEPRLNMLQIWKFSTEGGRGLGRSPSLHILIK